MRTCQGCTDKKQEPEWLSAQGLCPKCQVKKGTLQAIKKRKATNANNAA